MNDGQASVAENTAHGTIVFTALGDDVDLGETLSYSITEGNRAGRFAMNQQTGEVSVNGPIDFETNNTYGLTLGISDGELSDSATPPSTSPM